MLHSMSGDWGMDDHILVKKHLNNMSEYEVVIRMQSKSVPIVHWHPNFLGKGRLLLLRPQKFSSSGIPEYVLHAGICCRMQRWLYIFEWFALYKYLSYILQQRRAALFQNDRFIKTYHFIYILQHTQGWKKEKEIIKTINCASNSTVVIMSQSQMQFPYRS